MISAGQENAILKRIKKIPVVDTLQLKIVSLADGYCEVTAQTQYR